LKLRNKTLLLTSSLLIGFHADAAEVLGCEPAQINQCAELEIKNILPDLYSKIKKDHYTVDTNKVKIISNDNSGFFASILDSLFNVGAPSDGGMRFTHGWTDSKINIQGFIVLVDTCVQNNSGDATTQCELAKPNGFCKDLDLVNIQDSYGVDLLKITGKKNCTTCTD
jgi:hypothetical protein